mgnify:CR=1 FL=1
MVGIIFSNYFLWYYRHASRMYITHIKRNSRTLYVVSTIQGGKTSLVFLKITKNTIQVSGKKETNSRKHSTKTIT